MRFASFAIIVSLCVAHTLFGQSGGVPVHVSGPTSTTPDSPLRKFAPSTNPYARRIVTEEFGLVYDLKKIDPPVLAAFHSKVRPWEIANRGKPFNSTDVVIHNWPMRRFVLAGSAPGIWFILYEHGGIGYHHNLVVFAKDKSWQLVVAVSGFVKENNFESLKRAITAGEFADQPGYPQF